MNFEALRLRKNAFPLAVCDPCFVGLHGGVDQQVFQLRQTDFILSAFCALHVLHAQYDVVCTFLFVTLFGSLACNFS